MENMPFDVMIEIAKNFDFSTRIQLLKTSSPFLQQAISKSILKAETISVNFEKESISITSKDCKINFFQDNGSKILALTRKDSEKVTKDSTLSFRRFVVKIMKKICCSISCKEIEFLVNDTYLNFFEWLLRELRPNPKKIIIDYEGRQNNSLETLLPLQYAQKAEIEMRVENSNIPWTQVVSRPSLLKRLSIIRRSALNTDFSDENLLDLKQARYIRLDGVAVTCGAFKFWLERHFIDQSSLENASFSSKWKEGHMWSQEEVLRNLNHSRIHRHRIGYATGSLWKITNNNKEAYLYSDNQKLLFAFNNKGPAVALADIKDSCLAFTRGVTRAIRAQQEFENE